MPRKKLNLIAPVEEFGERWHAELPRGQITWLVHRYHVSERPLTLARDIFKRSAGWPRAMRFQAVRYAEHVRRENVGLYLDVARGGRW
jgi:hypothetical protein